MDKEKEVIKKEVKEKNTSTTLPFIKTSDKETMEVLEKNRIQFNWL